MGRVLYVVFVLLLTASCNNDEVEVRTLYSKWEWIRTDGGFAYHIHDTPRNTGKNIQLEFKQDHTFAEYTNRKITASGFFTLDTQQCIHNRALKQVIRFSGGLPDMMIETMEVNSLLLSDDANDGIDSQYKRK